MKIALNYFNCRGRAQVIRYALSDHDIDYQDNRLKPDEAKKLWPKLKKDKKFSGIFGKLPILIWNNEVLGETLVISQFLQEKFNEGLNKKDLLRSSQICSHIYTDLVYPMGQLLWNRQLYPGVDQSFLFKRIFLTVSEIFRNLNDCTPKNKFLCGMRPTLSDYFLYESLSASKIVFENQIHHITHSNLLSHFERMHDRTGILLERKRIPLQITANPFERETLENLKKMSFEDS